MAAAILDKIYGDSRELIFLMAGYDLVHPESPEHENVGFIIYNNREYNFYCNEKLYSIIFTPYCKGESIELCNEYGWILNCQPRQLEAKLKKLIHMAIKDFLCD